MFSNVTYKTSRVLRIKRYQDTRLMSLSRACYAKCPYCFCFVKCLYCLLLHMQSVLTIYCFICKVSLLFTASYAKCPYYLLLHMQSVLIV